ncbi:MAG TPA: LysR substrate-binding domain-containing protein [Acetobacteraceae bacterium]|jgi:LysR family transcriptional regulator, glycine cleavage system transcriptional activator|nr:LysR substrate-binding domain-containing protein [Acetobacteraceae bacterium]
MPTPSLRALRAFAEVARAGSVAEAARGLHVSPSAVSHLLHDLEAALGFALFTGRGPGAPLSEQGARLARRLGGAFEAIDLAVDEARHRSGDVRVSALTSFSTLWLVPRLARFQARHPEVRLLLATGMRPVDLAAEPFECAIRYGGGNWAGLAATLLFLERPVLVANPRLLTEPIGVGGLPRLAARTRDNDWTLVGGALGLPETAPVLTFETRALAVQAAIAGIGATVVDRHLVADLLVAGMLAEVSPMPPLERAEGHWFVALPQALRDRHVRAFREWLVAEVGAGARVPE